MKYDSILLIVQHSGVWGFAPSLQSKPSGQGCKSCPINEAQRNGLF